MQFKIGQQTITIMNMFNIFVQHTIKICKYQPPCVDKCVLFTFASPIIPLIYVPGHDLNSNASLNLDASLSHSSMNVHGRAKLHVL